MAEDARLPPRLGPAAILPLAAARHPDKVALVTGDVRLTYRQLEERSRSVAAALQRRRIGQGDIVSLYGQNSWEWIVSYHGALRSGAAVNPVNVMLTGPELSYVLEDCSSRALFAGNGQAATAATVVADTPNLQLYTTFGGHESGSTPFASLLAEGAELTLRKKVSPRPRDLCSIAYTSGTTGHPKGAMQSHQAVLLNCALTATMHGRGPHDVVVTALPTAHVYGSVVVNSTFLVGGTVVLMERFNAAEVLRLIESEHGTIFEGVPAMYSMILADPTLAQADLSSLRLTTLGGQTFPLELMQKWEQVSGAPMIELWGMTELAGLGTTHCIYSSPCPGSIGVSLPGIEIKIGPLDNTDHDVAPGEPGELMVRGPLVMLGYYGNPEATAEVLGDDGWLRTGDVAYADDTGHFFIVDRLKDMIVTAGYNVYPAEIERVIATHPDVAMVGVGPRPDEVRGEIAVAYVVPKPGSGLNEDTILAHCREHLAAYKRPREIVLIDRLPTTSLGKVMRRKLAEVHVEQLNGKSREPQSRNRL